MSTVQHCTERSKAVIDVPLLQLRRLLGIFNGLAEETDKPWQRVLIHRLNICQVSNREEEHTTVDSNGIVSLTCLVNLTFRFFSHRLYTITRQVNTQLRSVLQSHHNRESYKFKVNVFSNPLIHRHKAALICEGQNAL